MGIAGSDENKISGMTGFRRNMKADWLFKIQSAFLNYSLK